MLALIFGLIGLLIDVVFVVALHSWTSFDLSAFSLFFVVPIGAIVIGGLACLGYYIGILKSNMKVTKAIQILSIVITILCFVLIQYGFYYTAYLDENMDLNYKMQGEHVSNYVIGDSEDPVNFFSFTKLIVNSRVISFSNKGRQLLEVSGNKVVNWIFYAVGFLGMLAGAFLAQAVIIDKKYCDKCKKYMKQKELLKFPAHDTEKVNRFKSIVNIYPQEMEALMHSGNTTVQEDHYEVIMDWCDVCNDGYLRLQFMEMEAKNKFNLNIKKSIDIPINSHVTQQITKSNKNFANA